MVDLLPQPLQFSWKDRIFSLRSQSIQSNLIQQHLTAIEKLLNLEPDPELSQLQDENLWEELKLNSDTSAAATHLQFLWRHIEPLAHLSTRQLIHLVQEHIANLEKGYAHILAEIDKDDLELDLLPEILRLSRQNVRLQVIANQQRLDTLKAYIGYGLMFRALIGKWIKAPRQFDDVTTAFIIQINELKATKRLKLPDNPTATFDDDKRETVVQLLGTLLTQAAKNTITDQLISATEFKEDVIDDIIKARPARTFTSMRDKKDIDHERAEIKAFCEDIATSLDIISLGTITFSLKNHFSIERMLPKWITQTRDIIWKYRYIGYMLLSFLAYSYIIALIAPVAAIPVYGQTLLAAISNILYYTVGLGPFYMFTWKGINNLFTQWKNNEIVESLIVIEDAQRFITERLSPTPMDIPHMDIDEFLQDAMLQQQQLQAMRASLKRMNFAEKYFCKGKIMNAIAKIDLKAEFLEKQIDRLQNLLAKHIAEHIGEEIEIFELDISQQLLIHHLPPARMQQLRDFVVQKGSDSALQRFDENSNIINRWRLKISELQIQDIDIKPHPVQIPWGSNKPRIGVFATWKKLLTSFVIDPKALAACDKINKLLSGTVCMSPDELNEAIIVIPNGEELLPVVQDFIFSTLAPRSDKYAMLLSAEQKQKITDWYQANQADIQIATEVITDILSSTYSESAVARILERYTDEQLARYYALVDGAEYYDCLQQGCDKEARKNKVRQFFEEYNGVSSRVYQFIRFIPLAERPSIAAQIARKRLNWLLKHLDAIDYDQPFSITDVAMFGNIWVQHANFSFSDEIRNSEEFKQTNHPLMTKFLTACDKYELGNRNDLTYYANQKQNQPTLITPLKQAQTAQPLKTCRQQQQAAQSTDMRATIYGY